MAKAKNREYLSVKGLILRIQSEGFLKVKEDVGDRMDPVRATRIVEVLREYNTPDDKIDKDLLDFAATKRPGRKGGTVKSPADGETREYDVGANNRIAVPLSILGKKHGDKQFVEFSNDGIFLPK